MTRVTVTRYANTLDTLIFALQRVRAECPQLGKQPVSWNDSWFGPRRVQAVLCDGLGVVLQQKGGAR